jgi:hypothetical protein
MRSSSITAAITDGPTGSETEQAFIEALYAAFDEETEPTDLTIAQILNDLVPSSNLMAEEIAALKNWARGRAKTATSEPALEGRARKLVA